MSPQANLLRFLVFGGMYLVHQSFRVILFNVFSVTSHLSFYSFEKKIKVKIL